MIHLDTLENIKLYTARLSLNFALQVLHLLGSLIANWPIALRIS